MCNPVPARCRHCGRPKVKRPRGLCWSCYYRPGVREQYASTSRYAHRGVGHRDGELPLPTPTAAVQGTAEKLAALMDRAARGESLWHPADGGG